MKTRNYALDLLKIIATTFIVLHHYEQGTQYAAFEIVSFYGGKFPFSYFVELFFIISGYLAFGYINKIQQGMKFGKYFKKKYLRLVPLLAVSVFIETFIYWIRNLMGAENDLNFSRVVLNMLGIQTGWVTNTQSINGPTWYISVLLFCYVLFYFLTWLADKLDVEQYKFYIAIILIGVMIRTYGLQFAFFNMTMARGYIAFFVGVILARVINLESIKRKSLILFLSHLALLSFILIYIFKFQFIQNDLIYVLDFVVWPAVVIVCCLGKIGKSLNCSVIGTISAISFDTYIMHEPLTAFTNLLICVLELNVNLASVGWEVGFVVAAWITGVIFYFGVEKPINKFLDRV